MGTQSSPPRPGPSPLGAIDPALPARVRCDPRAVQTLLDPLAAARPPGIAAAALLVGPADNRGGAAQGPRGPGGVARSPHAVARRRRRLLLANAGLPPLAAALGVRGPVP